MKTVLQMCVALAFAGSAMGQTKPKDVDGWGKIKWGMTVRQAKAVLGTQVREVKKPTGFGFDERLIVDGIKVGATEMSVSIWALPGSEAIKGLTLWTHDHPHAVFFSLQDSLTQKYGRPTHHDSTNTETSETNSVTWVFPSTVITLLWMQFKDINTEYVHVEYKASDKKALDVL